MKLNYACVTCDAAPESPMHLFLECNFVRECWRYNASNINLRAMEGFREWLGRLFEEKNSESMKKIAGVMWGIWGPRNSKLWRGTSQTPQQGVHTCSRFLKEWDDANKEKEGRKGEMQLPNPRRWSTHLSGCLKCNLDAAIFCE